MKSNVKPLNSLLTAVGQYSFLKISNYFIFINTRVVILFSKSFISNNFISWPNMFLTLMTSHPLHQGWYFIVGYLSYDCYRLFTYAVIYTIHYVRAYANSWVILILIIKPINFDVDYKLNNNNNCVLTSLGNKQK